MTFFGHDVSSYNPDYQPVRGEFLAIKASEGARTHDPSFKTLLARAKAAGAIPIAYHFLHSDSSPAAQAANLASVPGVKDLPVMVDTEQEQTSFPNIAQTAQFVDECKKLGVRVVLVYLPHWYWQAIGSPGLTPLINRGLHLVSSAYPGGGYPGSSGGGWAAYGGMKPLIWQYTDKPVDGDAYEGTAAQLRAILYPGTKPPAPPVGSSNYTVRSGDTMSSIAAAHGLTLAELERLNPQIGNPNAIYPGEVVHVGGSAAPAPVHPTYTVRSGDTLSGIAAAHGTTTGALARINNLANPDLIHIGQVLKLK